MLKKIHIINCLSCRDTEIELDAITALIGRNAAGKTNILKTIEWCVQFAIGNMPEYGRFFSDVERFEINFVIDDKTFVYKRYAEFYCYNEEQGDNKFIESLSIYINDNWQLMTEREDSILNYYFNKEQTTIKINNDAPLISSIIAFLPQNKINADIKKIFNFFSEVKYYILDIEEHKIVASFAPDFLYSNNTCVLNKDYQQWLFKDKNKSSVVMRILHLWNKDRETMNELLALIGKNGLNLVDDINIESILSGGDVFLYTMGFKVANNELSYTQLSHGTQRVLIILLALLYDKTTTLLIEQPEDGIHSGLLKKLLSICFQYAKYYNKQLIIATHSPEIINLLPPESIRLVKMTEKGTKVSSLDKEQLPFIHDYIKEEGTLFDIIESMDDE